MRFKLLSLISLAGMLASCAFSGNSPETSSTGNELPEKTDVKLVCPTGAPAVAFYNHAEDKNFETNGTPSNIVAFMNNNSNYDAVVIDTISGLKAISNGAPYKMAATLTFGNFFIASTGHDADGVMNPGDKIVLFGQNQTPDKIFHYIYGNDFDSSIEYVTAVSDAAPCLASGKNVATGSDVDYVFVAQPVLFATLNNANAATYGKAKVYANIQELYKEKSGNKSIIQASLFVKNTDSYSYASYLSALESDINSAIADPKKVVEGMSKISDDEAKAKYGIASNVAKAVLSQNNGLGLGYKKAKDIKEDINSFISIFGMENVTDEVLA